MGIIVIPGNTIPSMNHGIILIAAAMIAREVHLMLRNLTWVSMLRLLLTFDLPQRVLGIYGSAIVGIGVTVVHIANSDTCWKRGCIEKKKLAQIFKA